MKPKPLASLNHLTVPVSRFDITYSLEHGLKMSLARRCAGCKEKARCNDGADLGVYSIGSQGTVTLGTQRAHRSRRDDKLPPPALACSACRSPGVQCSYAGGARQNRMVCRNNVDARARSAESDAVLGPEHLLQ